MIKIELHAHTKETSSCSISFAKDILKEYKENGYDAIVITDHFYRGMFKNYDNWESIVAKFLSGYKEAKKYEDIIGIKVFLGIELRLNKNNNDYLIYGIDEEFLYSNPYLYDLSLEEVFSLIKDKYIIVQAHPFRYGDDLVDTSLLHGIEIYNTNPFNNVDNNKAINAWKNTSLIATSGSDFHSHGCITNKHVTSLFRMPKSNLDLVKIFKNREYEILD